MNRTNFISIYKALVPTPLFFLLSIGLPLILKPYASTEGSMPTVVTYGLYALMLLGLVFSLRNAWKIQDKSKWILIGVIFILLPMQYILIAATEVGIFGK